MLSTAHASAPRKCTICLDYRGVDNVLHGADGCPFGKSFLCKRCHHRGHATSNCSADYSHWERPTTLEELIPADMRLRYRISTHTPIVFDTPRGAESTLGELGDMNEIVIPHTNDPDCYKKLGEFMRDHGIKVDAASKKTKESAADRIKAIKAWGVAHGYRIVQRLPVLCGATGSASAAGGAATSSD
jgi:hypothetical protein